MRKQQNLAIEYCDRRINVSSAAVYDHISPQPDGTYRMDFRGGNGNIAITISPLSHHCRENKPPANQRRGIITSINYLIYIIKQS